ncbi:nucleoporin GLE1 [Galendromus occidentalis]|uniref:mRNA export factor GLE1 n=1 Tax=Galendromus occidentalis TaxID=34638 RepID=A0AAJ6QY92_9ACAR|nr:nucleoporin GLE1 [Galendromus occidentalis]
MAPILDTSFEDAQKRARDFLQKKESKQRRSLLNEDVSIHEETTPSEKVPSLSSSLVSSENASTPEEYKRRLQQRRLDDIILSSPPGKIQWPSEQLSFDANSDSPEKRIQETNDNFRERSAISVHEEAEERLRMEAARMRALEERELFQLYEEADRHAREEHEKFLKRYTELQNALEIQYRRDQERISLEITERKQALLVRAKRDSELLVQLHKTLSEKSAESAKAFAAKSKEIIHLTEKAKQEEEKILRQKEARILREKHKTKISEIISTIDQSIGTLQKDLPESQSAKEELAKVKSSLQDPANHENAAVFEGALTEVRKILDTYAAALLAREQKKVEEAIKTQPKRQSENRYRQAVEKLKQNAEIFTKFIEENKLLRTKITRFITLTVNKIQKSTNNQEHALALVKLFSSDDVRYGLATDIVNLSGNKEAVTFSMDLTAKKILDSVEKLPAEPIQEWVPHATVVGTLWSTSPKFGDIFFNNLVSRCPFLVPVYFDDLTAEESTTYISKFVQYTSESWSSFIPRMGYYARLLGVICTMKPRWGPPFAPGKMWTLLASTVKCEIKTKEVAEVAAMVMKSLLETCGHTMQASYGRQFSKFIHLTCKEFYAKLTEVAKNAPSVISLEIFMKEVVTAGGKFTPVV